MTAKIPDIIVIGGGPAGLMASGRAAELGLRVLLIEKTYQIGTKLLMTGGGRCNITNNEDIKGFVKAFGKNGRFLYRAFSVFSNRDLIDFFAGRGVEMRIEADGKVFPVNDSAQSVLNELRKYIENNKVKVLHNSAVTEIMLNQIDKLTATGVRIADGSILNSGKVIIATGGMSYPETGSTGDGYELAKKCGHSMASPQPGLIPLESNEEFILELQGLTLKDIGISVLINGKKMSTENGDLLFTHFGVSGPKVLILSGIAVDALSSGSKVELSLQLKPEYNVEELAGYIRNELTTNGKKTFSQYLRESFPKSFAPILEKLCDIDNGKQCSMVSREERNKILGLFTDFRIKITKPRPLEEATITKGGVSLGEINPQTMESRIVNGLFFCGEVIDVDGITGGYNLQEAFSTGYLAGESAALKKT